MSNTVIKVFDYTGGRQTFTTTAGIHPEVEIHMWGGGGGGGGYDGGGGGGSGSGGWYYTNTINIDPGATVEVAVGGGGGAGSSGTGSGAGPGGYGGNSVLVNGRSAYGSGYSLAGGRGGNAGPGGWSGGGGGGGGASLLSINGSTHYVAAGGGGGGGGSNNRDGSDAYTSNGQQSSYRDITRVSNGAWSGFLNTYGVWNNPEIYSGGFDRTWTVWFPTTGTYTFVSSCDNSGAIYLDGNAILSVPSFQATYTYSATVTAGHHTVRVLGVNFGGPAGIGLTIDGPGGNIFRTDSLPAPAQGGSGVDCNGDGGGGGGGGGGLTGGAGGDLGYDNWRGGIGGYTGQATGGARAPSGRSPYGSNSQYWASPNAIGGGDREAGGSGRIVLVFRASSFGGIKIANEWKSMDGSYVKVGGVWRLIQAGWAKVDGVWRPLKGTAAPTISPTFSSANFGPASPEV